MSKSVENLHHAIQKAHQDAYSQAIELRDRLLAEAVEPYGLQVISAAELETLRLQEIAAMVAVRIATKMAESWQDIRRGVVPDQTRLEFHIPPNTWSGSGVDEEDVDTAFIRKLLSSTGLNSTIVEHTSWGKDSEGWRVVKVSLI